MKVNSVDNKANFGWRYPTHMKITAKAVDELPNLRKYKDILTEFVQKPDFDERGFKGNNHFYFTPTLFHPRESFLDLTGRNNAASKFSEHVFYFEELFNKDKNEALEHAGRALHFLQDVTQPQHTERGTVLQKWKDLEIHKQFEAFAFKNEDYFTKNAKPVQLELEPDNIIDLFDEAVFHSEHGKQVRADNAKEWTGIAQTGISNAIQVTKEFCGYISKFL